MKVFVREYSRGKLSTKELGDRYKNKVSSTQARKGTNDNMALWFLKSSSHPETRDGQKSINAAAKSPEQLLVYLEDTPILLLNVKDESEAFEMGSKWSD